MVSYHNIVRVACSPAYTPHAALRLQVARLHGIVSRSAVLESTSVVSASGRLRRATAHAARSRCVQVLAYGLDLFLTQVTPSAPFDLLNEGEPRALAEPARSRRGASPPLIRHSHGRDAQTSTRPSWPARWAGSPLPIWCVTRRSRRARLTAPCFVVQVLRSLAARKAVTDAWA